MKAFIFGILAAFFFSFTFILNRTMELEGGSWLWSAALRFIFMLPILALLLAIRGELRHSLHHLSMHKGAYLLWSTVGFGLFYAPLTFASAFSPGWLVAGCWQVTIIAGTLLLPFLPAVDGVRNSIPWRQLRWSLLILIGVVMLLWEQVSAVNARQVLLGLLPVLFAAFMYPLGNRRMMHVCQDDVDTLQRVFNMTLASQPFWLLIVLWGYRDYGSPTNGQMIQSFLVALFSGVIATVLFFAATQLVRQDVKKMATVEATQSGEVVFTLLGEMVILGIALPGMLALGGITLIILGIIVQSVMPLLRASR